MPIADCAILLLLCFLQVLNRVPSLWSLVGNYSSITDVRVALALHELAAPTVLARCHYICATCYAWTSAPILCCRTSGSSIDIVDTASFIVRTLALSQLSAFVTDQTIDIVLMRARVCYAQVLSPHPKNMTAAFALGGLREQLVSAVEVGNTAIVGDILARAGSLTGRGVRHTSLSHMPMRACFMQYACTRRCPCSVVAFNTDPTSC